MKLLVFGGWFGSRNLGDDAILIGLREILDKAIPEAEITALSTDPQYTMRICGVNAIKLQSPTQFMFKHASYRKVFRESDACIVTGGTPIYDFGHISRTIHFGIPRLEEKPIILFGVGAKPLKSLQGRGLIRVLLKGTSLISTRDQVSRNILMQVTDQPVRVSGDSALYVDGRDEVVDLNWIDQSRSLVIICPRFLSVDHKSHFHEPLMVTEINRIRHAVARTADSLVKRGCQVVFLPFHTVRPDDDRTEITRIRNLMKHRDVTVLEHPGTPMKAMKILGKARLVLGLRLHSLILAASQGVPVASMDYDIKIRGFMELAGVLDCLSHLDEGLFDLENRVGSTLDRHERYSRILEHSCEQMRRRIMSEAVRLANLLS